MASERSQRLVSSVLQIMLRGLPILLMAIVCGVTFLLVQVNTPQTDEAANQPKRHVADYMMDGVSATALPSIFTPLPPPVPFSPLHSKPPTPVCISLEGTPSARASPP